MNSYFKAVEVKNERTKSSAGKFGPKGTKQTVSTAQVKKKKNNHKKINLIF